MSRVRADVQETPLNVEGWWRRGEGGVPADQVCCHFARKYRDAYSFYLKVFFQRYFSQKHGKEQVRAAKVDKRKAKHNSDMESDGAVEGGGSDDESDPEEEVIWKVGPVKPAASLVDGVDAGNESFYAEG